MRPYVPRVRRAGFAALATASLTDPSWASEGVAPVDPVIEGWFARRTWQDPRWSIEELAAVKSGRRVSVVLPALDEEATVGAIVAAIVPLTRGPARLVDELVVVDSGSADRTVEVAAEAGARVVRRGDVLPDVPTVPGKGEVLWRSLAATTGDIVCYLDSDLVDFDPGFVPALLGPLLTEPGVALVKGFYRRPLRLETADADTGGGRVTELLVRPLLAALRPELSGIVQPLGGEYAGTRELLESVPFAPGYGVEIGLLLDTYARLGLDGLAQVNLGVRKHRNRSLLQLGVMSRQILSAALARCDVPDPGTALTQFVQVEGEWLPSVTSVEVTDRPPIRMLIGPAGRPAADRSYQQRQ
jgi:glucosyl-3-phosphoglycerate synthase